MEGYISIADYAKRRNVSLQSVYKRLNTTLKPYVKEIDGKKWLEERVFDLDASTVEQPKQPENINVDTTVEQPAKEPDQGISRDLLRLLEEQLKAKDAEIERLHRDIEIAREAASVAEQHNREQSKQLALLLAQSQELQRNNQLLLAERSEKKDPPPEQYESVGEEDPVPARTIEPQPKKKSFFASLFGWD